MNLQTPVSTSEYIHKIKKTDELLFLGSCFSQNIGKRCTYLGVNGTINPFGTIFNPISLMSCLDLCLSSNPELAQPIFNNGVFVLPEFHSKTFGYNQEECLAAAHQTISSTKNILHQIEWLVLTFGTSIAYKNKETGMIVANCHKQPKSTFERVFLSVKEMNKASSSTLLELKAINPDLKVICTVSPVRHTKEGLIDNNLSKSALIQLSHELCSTHSFVHYFPSYEIMMDELRDYRFYKKDMIHPNELAIDIIWKRFQNAFCTDETKQMIFDFQAWRSSKNHKPLFPESQEHQKFLSKLNEIELQLREKYPHFNFV